MCRVFSCIIDRSGKVYPQKDNPSHTIIAIQHGLKEDGYTELSRAKIEVTPRAGGSYGVPPSFDTWEVRVDEDSIPDWVGDRHYRSAMDAAHKWWKSRVITEDVEVSAGMWFVLEGSPAVRVDGDATLYIYGSSSPCVHLSDRANVGTFNASSPEIHANGDIVVVTTGRSTPKVTLYSKARASVQQCSAPSIIALPGSSAFVLTSGPAKIMAHHGVLIQKYMGTEATVVEYI